MLFDEFVRTNHKIAEHSSSSYEFLNNSAWSSAEYVRRVLNEWSKYFPIDIEYTNRFKSYDDQQHYSAFFELYMFTLLRKHGYDIKVHYRVDETTDKKPDFYVSKKNEELHFYVECSLSSSPVENLTVKKLQNQILDVVEKIDSQAYWININFVETGKKNISLRKFRDFLTNRVSESSSFYTFDDHPKWDYRDQRLFKNHLANLRIMSRIIAQCIKQVLCSIISS